MTSSNANLPTICSFPMMLSLPFNFFLLSNLHHGLRLDSVPVDFSPESGRLWDVHVAVSDFGRFFD